ncbi:MAG: SDR family oxidoreductase, partial [Actinomycetota bacterium]
QLVTQVAKEIGGEYCVANVLNADEVERIFAETENAFGAVDILVDIVGMGLFKTFIETTEEDWDRMFAINFLHVRLLMKGAALRMKESGGGTMVLIGSIDTVTSAPGHAAYATAKSALLSLVRSAAMELAEFNIRINAVSPGLTRTPRLAEMIDSREGAAIEPLGKVGDPSDIAGAALFLAGGLASHITGQTILVDGGASVMYAYTPR